MIRAERQERILAALARKGTVSAQDLAVELGASLATVRRDIADLATRNALTRTRGGARLPNRRTELPFDAKMMAHLIEKRRIGAEAGSRIPDGSFIACGGGTTVLQMLPAIRAKSLRLVTTAVNVALELRDTRSVEVILTGGTLRRRTAETVGHIAERTLSEFNFHIAVIGVDGIDPEKGFTTYDPNEAHVNRVMLERAREVWIVADHSKFDVVLPAVLVPIARATRLFTDTGAREEQVAPLEAAGVEVIRV